MGTRKAKNGKDHVAVWHLPGDPKEHTKSPFPSQAKAAKYARQMVEDYRRGTYYDPNATLTVEAWAREHAELQVGRGEHRATTAQRWQSVINNHLAGTALGRMRLVDVQRRHWDRWELDMYRKVGEGRGRLKASYVRKVVADVKSVFAAAADYDPPLIGRSPCPRKVSSSAPKVAGRDDTYTPEEVERLITAMAEIMPCCVAMVIVQMGLGLRIGELLALRVTDVNRFTKTVRIATQITGTANKVRTDELKTDLAAATLRAPQYVIDALVEHMATYPTGIDGSVFTHNGGPWAQGTYRRWFRKALQRAGIDPATRPHRTHDLRHFRGTRMANQGRDNQQIGRYLREKPETVMATYTHPVADEDFVAAEIDREWNQRPEVGSSVGRADG